MKNELDGLNTLINSLEDFFGGGESDKIKFFAWYIQSKIKKERFSGSDILDCYIVLNLQKPSNVNSFLNSLVAKKHPEILKDSKGYYLENRTFNSFEQKFGQRSSTILVDKLLTDLPMKLSNNVEKIFLEETVNCFRVKAFRAVIVMTWNLVFDHICNYILNDASRLISFNTQLPKSYPKAKINSITNRDEFSEFKESEIIQVCKSSGIISHDIYKILKEKLDKRNSAAHPSTITFHSNTAEEYIIDLISNVVLKLN